MSIFSEKLASYKNISYICSRKHEKNSIIRPFNINNNQ